MWISSGQCKWGLSIENEANSNSQLLMFSTSGNISLPHFFCLWWWSLLCTVCFSVIYVSLECILYWWFWLMIPALRLIKTHRLCWPSAKPLALGGNIKTHAICWQNTSAALKQPHCAKKASLSYIQKKKKNIYITRLFDSAQRRFRYDYILPWVLFVGHLPHGRKGTTDKHKFRFLLCFHTLLTFLDCVGWIILQNS